MRGLRAAAAAGCALLLGAAPAADAAKRRVPQGFYGVMLDREPAAAPAAALDGQMGLMARSGVESARVVFSWAAAQPHAGEQPDLARTDALVAAAAAHGVELLPVVMYAPRWARRQPDRDASPPARAGDYAGFLAQLVARYGPRGSLWAERRGLPRRPLRTWQVWNEPHLRYQWDVTAGEAGAYPGGYVALLRAARAALKRSDRRARVVLAGLTNDSWNHLRRLLRAGARGRFDVAAVQTYTRRPRGVLEALARVRSVMAARGHRRTPVWITETGWPAALGRTEVPSYHRSIVTTDAGMAARLSDGYALAASRRRAYRLGRVYWYTWASRYEGAGIFNFSGLGRFADGTFQARPAWRAYVRSARRDEGCVKLTTGRCR